MLGENTSKSSGWHDITDLQFIVCLLAANYVWRSPVMQRNNTIQMLSQKSHAGTKTRLEQRSITSAVLSLGPDPSVS